MNESRYLRVSCFVNEKEKQVIKEKMAQYGGQNMSAYLRKMAIDGYIINFDIPELKELLSLLQRASNNINQIAKRVNSTDRIYKSELDEIQATQEELWQKVDAVIRRIAELS